MLRYNVVEGHLASRVILIPCSMLIKNNSANTMSTADLGSITIIVIVIQLTITAKVV